MAVTRPGASQLWNSAYQEVLFGIQDPTMGWPWLYSGVTNVNGKAQFTSSGSNVYGTPNGKFLYQPTGTYAGIHVVVSVDSSGNILTNTDYVSNDTSATARICVNYIYRIYYGYPTQTNYIDVKPIWLPNAAGTSASLVTNIGGYLEGIFTIQPPTEGFDESMYSHFRIDILANTDLAIFLDPVEVATGDTEQEIIQGITGWVYDDDSDPVADPHKWYVANSTCTHAFLNSRTGATDYLSEEDIVTFPGEQIIVSKIAGPDADRIYNVFING